MKFVCGIGKIGVPKDRIVALIDKMDADQDGYVTIAEVKRAVKIYAKAVKRSWRFALRK